MANISTTATTLASLSLGAADKPVLAKSDLEKLSLPSCLKKIQDTLGSLSEKDRARELDNFKKSNNNKNLFDYLIEKFPGMDRSAQAYLLAIVNSESTADINRKYQAVTASVTGVTKELVTKTIEAKVREFAKKNALAKELFNENQSKKDFKELEENLSNYIRKNQQLLIGSNVEQIRARAEKEGIAEAVKIGKSVKQLRAARVNWEWDNSEIFTAVEGKNKEDLDLIKELYQKKYKVDLKQDYQSELGGKELERFNFLLDGNNGAAKAAQASLILNRAAQTEFFRNDSQELEKIIQSLKPEELKEFHTTFNQKYAKDHSAIGSSIGWGKVATNFEEAIENELSYWMKEESGIHQKFKNILAQKAKIAEIRQGKTSPNAAQRNELDQMQSTIDSTKLREMFQAINVDEKGICLFLDSLADAKGHDVEKGYRNPERLNKLIAEFGGKENIIKSATASMNQNELDWLSAILDGNKIQADIKALAYACGGSTDGTDEELIFSILGVSKETEEILDNPEIDQRVKDQCTAELKTKVSYNKKLQSDPDFASVASKLENELNKNYHTASNLLLENARLSRGARLELASRGAGTDEAEFERVITDQSTATELNQINEEINQFRTAAGRHYSRSDNALLELGAGELGGRDWGNFKRVLGVESGIKGRPTLSAQTPDGLKEYVKQLNIKSQEKYDDEVGWTPSIFLDETHHEMLEDLTTVKNLSKDVENLDRRGLSRLVAHTQHLNASAEVFRQAQDAIADRASTAAGFVVIVAVEVGTLGTATPFLVTTAISAGGGLLATGVARALTNGTYSIEDFGQDAALTIPSALAFGALSRGAGKFIFSKAIGKELTTHAAVIAAATSSLKNRALFMGVTAGVGSTSDFISSAGSTAIVCVIDDKKSFDQIVSDSIKSGLSSIATSGITASIASQLSGLVRKAIPAKWKLAAETTAASVANDQTPAATTTNSAAAAVTTTAPGKSPFYRAGEGVRKVWDGTVSAKNTVKNVAANIYHFFKPKPTVFKKDDLIPGTSGATARVADDGFIKLEGADGNTFCFKANSQGKGVAVSGYVKKGDQITPFDFQIPEAGRLRKLFNMVNITPWFKPKEIPKRVAENYLIQGKNNEIQLPFGWKAKIEGRFFTALKVIMPNGKPLDLNSNEGTYTLKGDKPGIVGRFFGAIGEKIGNRWYGGKVYRDGQELTTADGRRIIFTAEGKVFGLEQGLALEVKKNGDLLIKDNNGTEVISLNASQKEMIFAQFALRTTPSEQPLQISQGLAMDVDGSIIVNQNIKIAKNSDITFLDPSSEVESISARGRVIRRNVAAPQAQNSNPAVSGSGSSAILPPPNPNSVNP